ncbi:hypothetical protein LTR09_003689 [Extremus antarcticus]|uniref:Uncharacterized protein n=1 Tax=Extremus antarcticus TaxID=702011 RepID=A0AAJ0GB11_9PEZI|nr:hypothetical protein LTR09_003689 [Extremus antarcticus]
MLFACTDWETASEGQITQCLELAIRERAPSHVIATLLRCCESTITGSSVRNILRTAIEKHNVDVVERLVGFGETSIDSSDTFDDMLSLAIRSGAPVGLCNELLKIIDGVWQPLVRSFSALTALLLTTKVEEANLRLYTILDALLRNPWTMDPHVDFADNVSAAYATSIEAQWCFRSFVKLRINEFEHLASLDVFSTHKAYGSMLAQVLLQCSDLEAKNLIREHCDEHFGQQLLVYLIGACCLSSEEKGADYITAIKRVLSHEDMQFERDFCPMRFVLMHFPNDRPLQMTEIMRVLAEGRKVKTTRLSAWGEALDRLTNIPVPVRWDLAEILWRDDKDLHGLAVAGSHPWNGSLFTYDLTDVARYGAAVYYGQLFHYTSNAYELQQCIAHVVSKYAIKHGKYLEGAIYLAQIAAALHLREHMSLPSIQVGIAGEILVELLDHHFDINRITSLPALHPSSPGATFEETSNGTVMEQGDRA